MPSTLQEIFEKAKALKKELINFPNDEENEELHPTVGGSAAFTPRPSSCNPSHLFDGPSESRQAKRWLSHNDGRAMLSTKANIDNLVKVSSSHTQKSIFNQTKERRGGTMKTLSLLPKEFFFPFLIFDRRKFTISWILNHSQHISSMMRLNAPLLKLSPNKKVFLPNRTMCIMT